MRVQFLVAFPPTFIRSPFCHIVKKQTPISCVLSDLFMLTLSLLFHTTCSLEPASSTTTLIPLPALSHSRACKALIPCQRSGPHERSHYAGWTEVRAPLMSSSMRSLIEMNHSKPDPFILGQPLCSTFSLWLSARVKNCLKNKTVRQRERERMSCSF